MPMTKEYHRPDSLDEALRLLQRPNVASVPLAGGSSLVPQLRQDLPGTQAGAVDAMVDLAGLGLSFIKRTDDALRIGATTSLTDLMASDACRSLAGGLLARAARREGPVNLRNAATLGGTVMRANGGSELLLALAVLAAHVVVTDGWERVLPLPDLLADPRAAVGRGLVIEVRIPWPAGQAKGGLARVARTPADHPIVAAAALRDGESARVAIGGAAARLLLLRLSHPHELEQAVANALAGLEPFADFQGSAEYRQTMAPVVARRALAEALDT